MSVFGRPPVDGWRSPEASQFPQPETERVRSRKTTTRKPSDPRQNQDDPLPADAIALRGYTNLYRIRFYRGRYRLIYAVYENQQRVIATRVRPRGIAYIGMRDEI